MRLFAFMVAFTVATGVAHADAPKRTLQSIFDDANNAATQGRPADAIASYEQLVRAGVRSGDVYYNLATAWAQLGQLPRAVYFLETALQLDPSDEQAKHDLRTVEETIERERANREGDASIQRPNRISSALLHAWSIDALAIWLLVANVVLFVCLTALVMWRQHPRTALIVGASVGLATVVLCSFGIAARVGAFKESVACVVLADSAPLLEAPNTNSEARGLVRGGDRCQITRREGTYRFIELPDSQRGWVPIEAVGEIFRTALNH